MTAPLGFTIDPEFKRLLPPLTNEEYSELEKSLLSGKGSLPLLIVWKEDNILLDGHNRLKICENRGLKYDIVYESFDTRDGAKARLIQLQLGRRNLDPERASELRGIEHDIEMKLIGRPKENGTKVVHLRTRKKLALRHNVSEGTIENDVKCSRAITAIEEVVPGSRQIILGRGLSRADVHHLAKIAQEQPKAAKHVVGQFDGLKPKDLKRIIAEAMKALPRPEPKPKPAPKAAAAKPDVPVENLTLTSPPPGGKRTEEVILKGGGAGRTKGYIIYDRDSRRVFNATNEMVGWASWTWNPITGCWHDCPYCYAREIANASRMKDAYPYKFEPVFHVARLDAPKNTPLPKEIKRPEDRNVFVCSMADLFGKWVPDEWIFQVMERVRLHPEWNFLFLTKFPQRLRDICDKLDGFPPNAWVGCTVDGQGRVRTAEEAFRGLRAKVRWLSVEPMEQRLTFHDMSMFHWLVIGGKSASPFNGTPAGQPEWEWVKHLLKQAWAAGLKVYWKDNLEVRSREVPWA